jgi:hypothetical protein
MRPVRITLIKEDGPNKLFKIGKPYNLFILAQMRTEYNFKRGKQTDEIILYRLSLHIGGKEAGQVYTNNLDKIPFMVNDDYNNWRIDHLCLEVRFTYLIKEMRFELPHTSEIKNENFAKSALELTKNFVDYCINLAYKEDYKFCINASYISDSGVGEEIWQYLDLKGYKFDFYNKIRNLNQITEPNNQPFFHNIFESFRN